MCGRFTATFEFREIKIRWNLQGDLPYFAPRYNIAPLFHCLTDLFGFPRFFLFFCFSLGMMLLPPVADSPTFRLMKWGLVPSWALDPSIGNQMINARAETLLKKPSFRNLVSQRRCLIPADGFYEWRREGNRKVPVWIHLKKKEPFAFAGLWDSWRNVELGDILYTCTIITTEPNALLRPMHNRMPVIYDREMGRQWLEHSYGAFQDSLDAVLRPWPSEYMEAWDVSPIVNAPANDTPECIQPLPAGRARTGQLPLV